jgi:hypothetical protein
LIKIIVVPWWLGKTIFILIYIFKILFFEKKSLKLINYLVACVEATPIL